MKDFTELSQFDLDPAAIRLLDEEFCRQHDVVVLGRLPKDDPQASLPVGMLDPGNAALVGLVEGRLQRPVRPVQLTDYEIDLALGFGFSGEGQWEGQPTATADQLTRKIDLSADRRITFERGQSPAKMVVDMLSTAMRLRATDVHIETYANDVDVRFRIDGVLYQINTPITPANVSLVVSHVKVLADLNIVERFQSQDGHFHVLYTAADGSRQKVSLRVSIIPGPYGEDVVFRFISGGRLMLGLTELGMAPDLLARFQALMHTPGGLFLVTGPTASGKTTTLYAVLRSIASRRLKILTVEDPIELEIPKVNQKQIDARMSFAKYVRAFLRQNPDVILIGEIRDEETAAVALRAAQIGHLVLSTLHTRDAVSALNRISTLGIDANLLAITLIGVLAQRLVRRICPECRETYTPDPALLSALPRLPTDLVHVRGAGCAHCRGTGFYGQTGVFELLDFHDALRRLFTRSHGIPSERELELLLSAHMYDDALDKVRQGITTIEEVFRAVPLPER
ncbi:MAG: General secretion pathway protein E [Candidatus Ozemobacter sibiricus]|jgi:type II secretory ATPase GspE/PulE/Tfp pilus assembly ATPase PilB-like protein|uniref:General secretion pathway protein E n=1 Tax=Candidatus Ozemobacter sibiricus TaxID=2268124 RepID=A0A367ZLW2_9BACT|nr:MAG: General secretion pathway protein E [Candidatus Ozemobacter sibiricus]